jgi:hypothetical protein
LERRACHPCAPSAHVAGDGRWHLRQVIDARDALHHPASARAIHDGGFFTRVASRGTRCVVARYDGHGGVGDCGDCDDQARAIRINAAQRVKSCGCGAFEIVKHVKNAICGWNWLWVELARGSESSGAKTRGQPTKNLNSKNGILSAVYPFSTFLF